MVTKLIVHANVVYTAGIDEGCRLKEEKVAKEFGDKIKRYKEQLEALENKLDKLGK